MSDPSSRSFSEQFSQSVPSGQFFPQRDLEPKKSNSYGKFFSWFSLISSLIFWISFYILYAFCDVNQGKIFSGNEAVGVFAVLGLHIRVFAATFFCLNALFWTLLGLLTEEKKKFPAFISLILLLLLIPILVVIACFQCPFLIFYIFIYFFAFMEFIASGTTVAPAFLFI